MDDKEIDYIIYVRKSTDDGSGKQLQSIPDQIKLCLAFAKGKFKIKEKPKKFDLETKEELRKEDLEPNQINKELYQDTRHLYIVKEHHSAKTPRGRPKWEKIVKLVREGKIKGIISYSPDRQARNMVDGGEIIHLAHEELVDLKYANFSFINNAGGRMMLGVRFVFSKQYSDKLSEDVKRGTKSKVMQGVCLDRIFYGYKLNDEKKLVPDKESGNFDLMKEAFKRKLNDPKKRTLEKLADRLNRSGFRKTDKSGNKTKIFPKKLGIEFRDPMYYGLYVYKNYEVELEDVNPHFEPMITKEDHDFLIHRLTDKTNRHNRAAKEENKVVRPFNTGFVKDTTGATFVFETGNKSRFVKKLKILQETKPEATLADVIQPHQLKLRVHRGENKGLTITFLEIQQAVQNALDNMKFNKQTFELYVESRKENMKADRDEITTLSRIYGKNLTQMIEERDEYIDQRIGNVRTKKEREIYERKVEEYESKIDLIQEEIQNLEVRKRKKYVEFQMYIENLLHLKEKFSGGNYVRMGKIIESMCSHITVDNQKRLKLELKPGLEYVFGDLGTEFWGTRTRT